MEIKLKYEQDKEVNIDKYYEFIMEFIKKKKRKQNKIVNIDGKDYLLKIIFEKGSLFLNFENFDPIEIRYPPLIVIFPNEKKNNIIYNYNQLIEYFKYYKIDQEKAYFFDSYDYYDINIKCFSQISNKIYSISIVYKETLEDIFNNVNNLRKIDYSIYFQGDNINIEINKLGKYFKFYIDESNIDENKKFLFLYDEYRGEFIATINNTLKYSNELFITGLHGIGKSISLICLKFYKLLEINKFVYYNIDTLEARNEWKNIIEYETCFIFDTIKDFNEAFQNVNIKNSKNYMEMIFNIIKYTKNNNYSNSVCFIIDQFDTNKKENRLILEKIRSLFKSDTDKSKLIVCSTINDETVRNDILMQFKIVINENDNYIYNYLVFDKIIEMKINDSKLSRDIAIFNYFPIFVKQFEDSKDANETENKIIKYIEEDLKKFWGKKNVNDYLYAINSIQNNIKKIIDSNDLYNYEKYFSFKYFRIYKITIKNIRDLRDLFDIEIRQDDIDKYIINYSFLFMEFILKIMKKKEYKRQLNNTEMKFFEKNSEKGNIFEFCLEMFFIENKLLKIFESQFEKIDIIINIFSPFNILRETKNKEYVEYYSKTKETIANTNDDQVILFCFDEDKVKRIDFLILIKKTKTAIGIQASIHKEKKDLIPFYNKKTIKNDFSQIIKQFKEVYNEDIEHFYLYFFLYENTNTFQELENNYYANGLDFLLFDPFSKENKFKELNIKEKKTKNLEKIKLLLNPEKDYEGDETLNQTVEEELRNFNDNLSDYKDEIYNSILAIRKKRKYEVSDINSLYIKDLYINKNFNDYLSKKHMIYKYTISDEGEITKFVPSFPIANNKFIAFIRIIEKDKDFVIDASSKEMNVINLKENSPINLKLEYNLSNLCKIIYFKLKSNKKLNN